MNRGEVSSSLRGLARQARTRFPALPVHQHLADAAAMLDAGQHQAAIRHLNAACASLSPLQLRRAGLAHDDDHTDGKRLMVQAHRHLLNVKDLQDQQEPVS